MASKRKTPRRSTRKSKTNQRRSHARHAVLAKRKRATRKSSGLRTLYPALKPRRTGMLRVSDVHEIVADLHPTRHGLLHQSGRGRGDQRLVHVGRRSRECGGDQPHRQVATSHAEQGDQVLTGLREAGDA